jgi:hypothetical protein
VQSLLQKYRSELVRQSRPVPKPPGPGGSCPHGYTSSGSYCVPSQGAADAIAKPPNGTCPWGLDFVGGFAVALRICPSARASKRLPCLRDVSRKQISAGGARACAVQPGGQLSSGYVRTSNQGTHRANADTITPAQYQPRSASSLIGSSFLFRDYTPILRAASKTGGGLG